MDVVVIGSFDCLLDCLRDQTQLVCAIDQLHQQQMKSAQQQQQPSKRSDFVVGTTVLIRVR